MHLSREEMRTHSDEVLCQLVVNGNLLAEEVLVLRYNRVVRICTRPYFLVGGDNEDLIQEGLLGLVNAIREFRVEKNVLFKTFAETCIRNRILSAIKSATRDKHAPLNQATSLELPLNEGSTDGFSLPGVLAQSVSPEDLLIGREEHRERLTALTSGLSRLEQDVLGFYLQGLSYDEIATHTGRTSKAVDNAVQRIRRKLAQRNPDCISED